MDKSFVVKNSLQVNTNFTANSTLVTSPSLNVNGQVNATTLYVATSANISTFVVNSSGALTTGYLQGNTLTITSNTANIGTAVFVFANGFVGIGNSTPAYKLDVAGDIHVTGNVYANAIVTGSGGNFTANSLTLTSNVATFGTASYFVANGFVGLNGISSPTRALDVTGDIHSTNTISSPIVAANNGIFLNSSTISANETIASGFNGLSAGPITLASNVTVTVTSGQQWVVVQ